jgi:hypothetical protein
VLVGEINICNQAGRDAVVTTESVRSSLQVRWVDSQARQAKNVRILKSPIDRDINGLRDRYGGLDKIARALIDSDPEVDIEMAGKFLRDTSRVYVDQSGAIVHKVQQWEIIRNPDGSERDRRARKMLVPNLSSDLPLRWSGVFVKREDACRKFVFVGKVQLLHVNGLTYDFLYGMAKELEDKDSLMLLGAGPKSNQPLILRRGGTLYRGFLEGRTDGDKYCLLLHFSNMELKAPREETSAEATP